MRSSESHSVHRGRTPTMSALSHFSLFLFLIVATASSSHSKEDSELVSTLIEHLNARREGSRYTFEDGSLISSQRRHDLYIVRAALNVKCSDTFCSTPKTPCLALMRLNSKGILEIFDDKALCELPFEKSHYKKQVKKHKHKAEKAKYKSLEEKRPHYPRSKRSFIYVNQSDETFINRLAEYAFRAANDSNNHVVFKVVDSHTSQKNQSTFYYLRVIVPAPCQEGREACANALQQKLEECNVVIEVSRDGKRKISKFDCAERAKRYRLGGPQQVTLPDDEITKRSKRQVPGGIQQVTLPNDDITAKTELAVNHYDLHSSHDNRHGIVDILSASRQIVAGTKFRMEFVIKEIDCLKTQPKGKNHKFVEGAVAKRCSASVWSRPWLNKNDVTVDCKPV